MLRAESPKSNYMTYDSWLDKLAYLMLGCLEKDKKKLPKPIHI
jgi:hypothetical protein